LKLDIKFQFSLNKKILEEKNSFLPPRSQECPLSFLGGHGGVGALPDELDIKFHFSLTKKFLEKEKSIPCFNESGTSS
jgi:hypothetical protein